MTANPNSPPQEQIEEWLEGETTRYFLALIRMRLDRTFKDRAEIFFPCEPQKTQEGKLWLLAEEGTLQDIIEAFESKDLSLIEDLQTDEERVRHSPLRRPRPDPAG